MAVFTDAQVRPSFDQKWDLQVLQARYGRASIGKNVLNRSALVEESGEIVNITVKPRVTGGTVGTDGGFTSETYQLSNVQINVNTWRYVSNEITDKQSQQAIINLETELPKQFGDKLGEFAEIDLADLFLSLNGFSGVVGIGIGAPGGGVNFEEDSALLAVQATRRRQLPTESLSWQLPVEAFYQGWLKKERLTSAYATGEAKSTITTGIYGFKQMILGIPAFESTLLNGASTVDIDTGLIVHAPSGINVAGTTCGALLHEEALGYAFQINSKTKRAEMTAANRLATTIVCNSLYGVRVVRSSHGVPIYIANGG